MTTMEMAKFVELCTRNFGRAVVETEIKVGRATKNISKMHALATTAILASEKRLSGAFRVAKTTTNMKMIVPMKIP